MSSTYERELKKKLEEKDWVVIRSAGSLGEADLISMKVHTGDRGGTIIKTRLIEVKKTSKDKKKYLTRQPEQWTQMVEHAERGIPVYYAVRFTSGSLDNRWQFYPVEGIEDKDNPPVLRREEGLDFHELFRYS